MGCMIQPALLTVREDNIATFHATSECPYGSHGDLRMHDMSYPCSVLALSTFSDIEESDA